MIVNEFER